MSTEQLRFTLSLDTSGVDTGAAKAAKSLRDVEKAASQVGTTTAKAGTEASTGLGKTATAADTAGKAVAKAGTAASKAGREAAKGGEEAAKGWGKFSEAAQSDSWGKVTGSLAMVGAALALPVGVATKEFATFDQAMSGVASTGDDARASISALREAALEAGADTAFSATESANAVEELARAGVSAADTLGGGLTGSLDLAAAGTIDVANAAGIASTAMTQFKLSGADIPHVADLLAAGAGKAMGGVDDLGMALKQGGLVASQFGLSIEETVGGLAAFASAGLLGSDAGTSLKTMLLALANPTGKSKQLLDELGISAYDAQGNFVGLEGLAGQLKAGMEGLTDAQRQQALATIFGTDAIRPASILYEQGAEGIRSWTEAVDDAGYAAETAATLQDNLVGDLEKLGGSWSTLAITMGEAADGPLRSAVQGLTGLLDAAAESPAAAQAIFGVAAGLGGLALGAAALMKGVTFVAEFRDASAKLAATSPGYGKVASGLGKVAGAAAGLATAATAVVLLGELAENLRAVKAGADVAEASVTRLIAGTGDLDAVFKRADGTGIWESMGFSIDSVASAMDHLVEVSGTPLEGLAKSAQAAREQFGLIDQELSTLTMAQSTDVFAGIAEQAAVAGMSVEDLTALFPDYAAQVQQLAAANGLGELSATDLAAAMSGTYEPLAAAQQAMGDTTTAAAAQEGAYDAAAASAEQLAAAQKEAADAARAAVDAFTAELDAIQSLNDAQTGAANTQLAAERAADSYRDKLDKISETLAKNGNSFDETTEKGRANREALRDLASSARSTTDAMLANGDSVDTVNAKMATQRDEFIKVATAAGIPKKAAKDLADSYGLIPNYVDTTIAVKGAKLSQQEAEELNEALEGLPDDVKTDIITLAQTYGVEVAREAIASIPDETRKTIKIDADTWGAIEAQRVIDGVEGKTVTINVNTKMGNSGSTIVGNPSMGYKTKADGGILEYHFAAGGALSRVGDVRNAHKPEIVPAGTNRLFAEDETGGEAYIPLANDWRRPRAENILATVADRFGLQLVKDVAAFAGGGVMLPTAAQSATLAGLQVGVMPVAQIAGLAASLTSLTEAASKAAVSADQHALALAAAEKEMAKAKTGSKAYQRAEADLKATQKAVDPRSTLGKNKTKLRDLKRKSTKGLSKSEKESLQKKIDALQKKIDKAEDRRNLKIAEARDKFDWEAEKRDKAIAAADEKLAKAKAKEAESSEKAKNATEKLTEATKTLESVTSSARATAESFAQGYMTYGDTVEAVRDLGAAAKSAADSFTSGYMKIDEEIGGTTGWVASMVEGAEDLTRFGSQIAQLRALGLDEAAVQQIISWGAEAGSAIAHDIITRSSGMQDEVIYDSGVKAVNEAFTALTVAAERLGGIAVASGKDDAAAAWQASMTQGAKELKVFTGQVAELRRLGLNESLVQQIIDWGQDAGGIVAADIIAQGKPGAEAMNQAGDQLRKASETLGLSAALGELKLVEAGDSLTRAADRLISAASAISSSGGKKAYAEGGFEDHTAHIATRMRVFAEPETGGEAYIPLAASKRARSLAIWAETGRRLGVAGFANGGLRPAPPRAISAVPALSADVLEAVVARLATVLRERPTTSLTVVNPLVRDSMREARLAREELEVIL